MSKTSRLVYLALLVTFAVVIHTIESALGITLLVPGAKLGLANIITLLTILLYGFKSGMVVSVMRCLIGFLIVGNPFTFALSLSGAVFSTLIMGLAFVFYQRGLINVLTISILGAAAHNTAQVIAASFVVQIPYYTLLTFYLPLLLLLALPTGVFTGLAAMYLHRIAEKNLSLVQSLKGAKAEREFTK